MDFSENNFYKADDSCNFRILALLMTTNSIVASITVNISKERSIKTQYEQYSLRNTSKKL